ncbi:Bug family tripartite tricarboxylate transporter substrate binding protein [Candidimonas nitroreducens]|uniref:ABC transporter substrate-binding protein n=1 Tax=Candidimonas nitroreducens TaxID=683354 RepID=A0A225M6E8_9BURK|nr:tripartite tricarboxylate transporter substrate binding protein [Candidimonas nitroreducens]OWT56897.1 hypothetical protein CEY11_18655 [Candidimonas nitroreducens]
MKSTCRKAGIQYSDAKGAASGARTPDMVRRSLLASTLMSVSMPLFAAQAWPSRPITIVIPYSPGTGNDIVGRLLAAKLPKYLGNDSIVVENRAGASGYIATDYVRRAKPDGYVMLLSSVSFSINVYTMKVKYGVSDFSPVAMVGRQPFTLVVNRSVPASSVAQLVAYMKANPGKLSAGQGGPTGTTYFLLESFEKATGVHVVSAAYKGTTDAMMDLLADRIQLLFAPISTSMSYLNSGHVRVLGVTGSARTPIMPDVPTFTELGYPMLDISTWFAFLGPAGMPRHVVDTMDQALSKTLMLKEVAEPLIKQGIVPSYESADKLGSFLRSDMEMWGRLVNDSAAGRQSKKRP